MDSVCSTFMLRHHFSLQGGRKKVEKGVKRWNLPTSSAWHTSAFTCRDGSFCSQWCACTHNPAVIALPVWPLKRATEGHVSLIKIMDGCSVWHCHCARLSFNDHLFRNFLQPFSEQIPGRHRPHLLILLSKVISLSTLQRLYVFLPLPRGVQAKRGRISVSNLFSVPSQGEQGLVSQKSTPPQADRADP